VLHETTPSSEKTNIVLFEDSGKDDLLLSHGKISSRRKIKRHRPSLAAMTGMRDERVNIPYGMAIASANAGFAFGTASAEKCRQGGGLTPLKAMFHS